MSYDVERMIQRDLEVATERALHGAQARQEWLQDRRKGIGGTDAAAILGVSPWAGPIDVWRDKTGVAPLERLNPDDPPIWWGRKLEPLILERYTMATGRETYRPGLLRHPDHPVLLANPDALVADVRRGVEAKTARTAEGWGEEGTDQMPPAYLVQVIHYMAVTGFESWDCAVLIGASDLRIYTVYRDEAFEREIVARLLEWWDRHVVKGEVPALDGSDGARRYVHARYPQEVTPLAPAPPEAEGWARRLAAARAVYLLAEKTKAECETNLKALIGGAEGLQGEDWKATWRLTRGRRVVDWEALARAKFDLDHLGLERAIQAHTSEREGYRRLLFTTNAEG